MSLRRRLRSYGAYNYVFQPTVSPSASPRLNTALYAAKMKRPFLCVYDYGQGGIWLLIDARTPEEIEKTYPELKAFADRPEWMKETEKTEYVASIEKSGRHYDIDTEPSGWLKSLCEKRK